MTSASLNRRPLAWLVAGLLASCWQLPSISAQQPEVDDGMFVTVPNPIKEESVEQIKLKIERTKGQPNRSVKRIVFDFNPQGKESSTKNYGVCYNLASYIRNLSLNQGIKTIGFVQAKTTGHTVLPVLACSEIIMTSDSSIGHIVEPAAALPDKSEVEFYNTLAGSKAVFVRKMFDPNVRIMSGLLNQNTIYFDERQRDEAPYVNAKNPQVVPAFAAGQLELYPAKVAQHYELCKRVLEVNNANVDKRELLRLEYGLPRAALVELALGEKACRIEITGAIDTIQREKINRQLNEAISRREDTIFFILDTAGGDLQAAYELAKEILELKDKEDRPITTVAYIPDHASDLGLFIAVACSDIVMYSSAKEEATLGDFEGLLKVKGQNPEFIKKQFQELLNLRKEAGRPSIDPLLIDALIDPNLAVVRGRHEKTGEVRLFTKREIEQQKEWRFDGSIKEQGQWLKLTGTKAKELRIVRDTVDKRDIKEVYSLYQFESRNVRDAEPHWLDSFGAFLRRKEVAIILVLIGIAGLILEMKAPGMAIPGITAALCFVLFFWSQSQLNEKIIYLAIGLFILGLVLIAMEIFVFPGFGIPGVCGILFVLGGLGLATVDKIPSTTEEWGVMAGRVMQYGLTFVASTVVAVIIARYLPKIPYANRLMLVPPTEKPEGFEPILLPGAEQAAALLGKTGFSTSMLRPSGSARFGDIIVDVVSEGDFIPPGTSIQVVEVEGTRIVVKRV